MNTITKIVVVIPTFNRKEYLRSVLTDIRHFTIDITVRCEIVVVVDGSTDGTREMLQHDFPEVNCVTGNNCWYTRSMNLGFEKALTLDPEYVLTLNDDVRLPNNYLTELLHVAKQTGISGIVGSVSLSMEKPRKITSPGVRRIHPLTLKCITYPMPQQISDTESLTGTVPSKVLPGRGMLIPVHILKELNFFDARFAQYHSDFDFCLRARKKGYSCYVCYNARLFSHVELTSGSTSFVKKSFVETIKLFGNKHSRIYIPDNARYIYRHGIKILWPLSFLIFILATFKSGFLRKNIHE